MKALTRVAFYALLLSSVSISTLHAQEQVSDMDSAVSDPISVIPEEEDVTDVEADDDKPLSLMEANKLIQEMPGAKDAITGVINTKTSQEIYDIYGRQLAYREGAKKYRASLEERRKNFAVPRTKMIERYKEVRIKVHQAQSAAYQEGLDEQQDSQDENEKPVVLDSVADSEAPISEEESAGGLVEQMISEDAFEGDQGQMVQKKVVTSDDAPEFDPMKLGDDPAPFINFEEADEVPEVAEVSEDAVAAEDMIVIPTPEFTPSIDAVPEAVEESMPSIDFLAEDPMELAPATEAPVKEVPSILSPVPEALEPVDLEVAPEKMHDSIKAEEELDGGAAFPPRLAEENPFGDIEVPPSLDEPVQEPIKLDN